MTEIPTVTSRPKKVAIIGSGGSGKSILARELGQALDLPVYHLDALFWRPGWVETPKDEWRATIEKLVEQDAWILDGNYGGTMEIRLAAADTMIFLDLPRTLCLWRVLKRTVLGVGRTRPDMAPGCPEKFSWEFLQWIWDYPSTRRPRVLKMIESYSSGREAIVLRRPSDVREFLRRIADTTG